MQVSDNLSPSSHRYIDQHPPAPCSPNIIPHPQTHSYTFTCIYLTAEDAEAKQNDPSLLNLSLLPTSSTPSSCSIIPCHVYSYMYVIIELFTHSRHFNEERRPLLLPLSIENTYSMLNIGDKARIQVYYDYKYIHT